MVTLYFKLGSVGAIIRANRPQNLIQIWSKFSAQVTNICHQYNTSLFLKSRSYYIPLLDGVTLFIGNAGILCSHDDALSLLSGTTTTLSRCVCRWLCVDVHADACAVDGWSGLKAAACAGTDKSRQAPHSGKWLSFLPEGLSGLSSFHIIIYLASSKTT